MESLSILDKTFLSIAFAEERSFKFDIEKMIYEPLSRIFTMVAFAEEGASHLLQDSDNSPNTKVCEMGDVQCFLSRNS